MEEAECMISHRETIIWADYLFFRLPICACLIPSHVCLHCALLTTLTTIRPLSSIFSPPSLQIQFPPFLSLLTSHAPLSSLLPLHPIQFLVSFRHEQELSGDPSVA